MTKTITRKILISKLVTDYEFSEDEAKGLVKEFFQAIVEIVSSGEELCLTGFGSFLLRLKSSRPGRNPKTGKEYIINQRKVVCFRTSALLKEKLKF